MSNRTKSGLIIAATLVIGLLLGACITGALHRHRLARLRELHEHGGITSVIRRRARPGPQQREALRRVLKRYEPRLRQIRERHYHEMEQLLDSLGADLEGVLTPEQLRRLLRDAPPRPGSHPQGRGRGQRQRGPDRRPPPPHAPNEP